jgi:hypothetical protein
MHEYVLNVRSLKVSNTEAIAVGTIYDKVTVDKNGHYVPSIDLPCGREIAICHDYPQTYLGNRSHKAPAHRLVARPAKRERHEDISGSSEMHY